MLRFLKNALLILCDLIVLLTVAMTTLFVFMVESRLQEIVRMRFDGFYTLEYAEMNSNINPFDLNVTITDAKLTCDTIDKSFRNRLPYLNFKAHKIRLSDIGTWSIILQKDVRIGKIEFEDPDLEYFLTSTKDSIRNTQSGKQSGNQKLNRDFVVEHFSMNQGKLRVYGDDNYKKPIFKTDKIDISFRDLRVLKRFSEDISYIQYKQVIMASQKAIYTPLDSDYYYDLDSLRLDKENNYISIKGIDALCQQTLTEHSFDFKNRKLFAESKLKNLVARGVDFNRIMDYGQVYIERLYTDSCAINMLQNYRKQHDKNKRKQTLREMVAAIDFPLIVDTLSIKRTKLTYNIFSDYDKALSKIWFTDLHGEIYNINSIEGNSDTLDVNLTANILETGKIVFKTHMPLSDTTNFHTYSGSITHLAFSDFNTFFKGLAPVRLDQGKIDKITFEGEATDSETWGTVSMFYHDLKFTVLKPDSNEKAGLKTMIANWFVRKKNDQTTDDTNWANYYHRKPKYKGMVVLWLGGILSGMKEVMLNNMAAGMVGKQIDKKM